MVGMAAPILAFLISTLTEFEAWLRIISLLVGIGVGVLTGWSIWRRRNK
jgi:hypothetical protein